MASLRPFTCQIHVRVFLRDIRTRIFPKRDMICHVRSLKLMLKKVPHQIEFPASSMSPGRARPVNRSNLSRSCRQVKDIIPYISAARSSNRKPASKMHSGTLSSLQPGAPARRAPAALGGTEPTQSRFLFVLSLRFCHPLSPSSRADSWIATTASARLCRR